MKLLSICVGLPREVEFRGQVVRTSIFKSPVAGPVHVARLNLDGDYQSDLTVHGGVYKAIYAYPSEHYAFWRNELPEIEFTYGIFGENFTIDGLLEDTVRIGDTLRIGSAEFVVTQPRMPCYKLGVRFGRADMTKRFHNSRRSGFYLAVTQEGSVEAGESIEFIANDASSLTITDIYELYATKNPDRDLLERASRLSGLPESWRSYFRERLDELDE